MGPVDPSAKNPGKNTVPGALWHILYMDLIFCIEARANNVTAVQKCSLSGLVF